MYVRLGGIEPFLPSVGTFMGRVLIYKSSRISIYQDDLFDTFAYFAKRRHHPFPPASRWGLGIAVCSCIELFARLTEYFRDRSLI